MSGTSHRDVPAVSTTMVGVPSPFGSDPDEGFDDYDEFVPEHLPGPGPFLDEGRVLTGEDHVAVHRLARDLFEERTVYDVTFNYNLARLNLDGRHEDAGYRYAEETASESDGDAASAVLRAEFTPTTPFCPQTHTLTIGSFRAWNGLADRHEYDLVRVRAARSHHGSEAINDRLADLEAEFRRTGEVPVASSDGPSGGPDDLDDVPSSPGPTAPF